MPRPDDPATLDRRRFLGLLGLAAAFTALPAAALPVKRARPRAPEMLLRSSRPLDLETPVAEFLHYLTPTDAFFVRSHHDAPQVDAAAWRLRVGGLVDHPLALTLAELKAMPRATVTAVLQCAGNGRAFFSPKVPGVPWERGAAGNARWTGVRLADVLARAGVKPEAAHLAMVGADAPVLPTAPRFARSIPLEKALHPDTLLAYAMNDQPLTAQHGFPLRLVCPGWVGDDWVKWLASLTLQTEEHDGFFVQTGYRYPLAPGKPGEPVPPELSRPMTNMRVKSLIATPAEGARLTLRPQTLQGVAWTGADARIAKVEVSADGGSSWIEAELFGEDRPYAWRQWRLRWNPPHAGRFALISRATDTAGETQPLRSSPWNPGGYQWNAADGVAVQVLEA